MIDHDNLEEFRDPQIYDLEDEGYDEDWLLTEQWVRSLGGRCSIWHVEQDAWPFAFSCHSR